MTIQRWTLVVVCAATAMLMLDIAVVNTALSRIADDLNTGLSGLQWVVDAYTLALASVVLTAGSLADRLGRRRAVRDRPHRSSRSPRSPAALAQDITMLNAARAVQGVGAAIMFAGLARAARPRVPGPRGARRRARRLRRHDRRLVRGRPARRRRAHERPRLAVDLPRQPADRHRSACAITRALRRGVARPALPRHRLARPDHADRRPVPARARAAARQRAGLGEHRRSSPSWPAPRVALVAFVAVERRVSASRCCRSACSATASFTGAQIAAFAISASFFAVFLYTTLYLQQVLGLSAIEAGLVYLPGTMMMLVVSGATAQLGAKVPARTMIARRPRRWSRVGMVLFTLAGVDSSWTVVLPGELDRADRHRPVQPGRERRRAGLGAAGAERPGRRRERHVPPGRHRRRRRRARRADPGRRTRSAAIARRRYVDGLHDALLVGRRRSPRVGAVAAGKLISKRYGAAAEMPPAEGEQLALAPA